MHKRLKTLRTNAVQGFRVKVRNESADKLYITSFRVPDRLADARLVFPSNCAHSMWREPRRRTDIGTIGTLPKTPSKQPPARVNTDVALCARRFHETEIPFAFTNAGHGAFAVQVQICVVLLNSILHSILPPENMAYTVWGFR